MPEHRDGRTTLALQQSGGASLVAWLVRRALAGMSGGELLEAFCVRLVAGGLPLLRAHAGTRLLDPTFEAHNFSWQRGAGIAIREFARRDNIWNQTSWTASPFHHLQATGGQSLRRRIEPGGPADEFPVLRELQEQGATDYLAIRVPYAGPQQADDTMDLLTSWATDHPGGFSDAELALLGEVVPAFALAFAHARNALVMRNVLATYLGRDAARRVLAGNVVRGRAEHIEAAIWFSDLESFTRIADELPQDEVLILLNDYTACLVETIENHHGEVLKFIGDGILAIFRDDDPATACTQALDAAEAAQAAITSLNARRSEQALRTTTACVALHRGELLYGNFGGARRLDFTVLGPAVNEASRIEALCRSLDQRVIVSAAFAAAAGRGRERLVGLGRYAFKGVGRSQELFTLDPGVA
jgi:adenylate cyclase